MIVLNEKDADRIASYLRKRLKEMEAENAFAEKMLESQFRKMSDMFIDKPIEAEFVRILKHNVLKSHRARKEEIAELLALLMAGSEEGVEK